MRLRCGRTRSQYLSLLYPNSDPSSLRFFSKYAGSQGSFFSIPVVIGSSVLSSVISFQVMFGPNVAWRLTRP
jgi:hypothetical protein